MKIAYQSDIGKQRDENQDYVGTFKNNAAVQFAVVADGIGGHQGGDVASEIAVSHMGHRFSETDFKQPEVAITWLSNEVQRENKYIIQKAEQFASLNGMGTTLVAAIIFQDQFLMANIGDSRGYLFRNHRLEQLTEDHSLVNELVKRGEISAEEARTHPQKNIITRTLGISSDAEIDINLYQIKAADQLLLCSDGLTNMVTDQQLAEVMSSDLEPAIKCQQLIERANAAGGTDNITVLIVDKEGGVAGK